MISTLPTDELIGLQWIEAQAEAMAAGGYVARGFLCLTRGLRRAQAAWEAQEPWGKELARRYQEALDRFSERHAMKSTAPGPSVWRVTLPPARSRPAEE